jgi:hypothetical protein
VTGSRRYGQSSQGATEPRPGRDGLGLPTHGVRVHVCSSARQHRARRRGDRAQLAHRPRLSTGMNFKARVKTSSKQTELNHLNHTARGISGYRQGLKHDTLPKLKLTETICELRAVLLLLNLRISLSLRLILFASSISKLLETLASNNTLLRQKLHYHL